MDQKVQYKSQSSIEEVQQRCHDLVEIYNEEMSPTSVSIGYDDVLQKCNKKIALKKIFKDQLLNDLQRKQAQFECVVHKEMKHEQIVNLYEWTENDKEYDLILEYVNDAQHFIQKIDEQMRPITREEKMKSYMTDVLEALSYIHANKYIHCDIKLDNLFCEKIEGEMIRSVKIGDFGLVHPIDPQTGKTYIQEKCGTASYIAPELQSKSYVGPSVDIWSLGIILYKMSCGYKPTMIQGYKYGQGPIPFRKFDWKRRSQNLKDIITSMLEMDPSKRPTSQELLQHPWFDSE